MVWFIYILILIFLVAISMLVGSFLYLRPNSAIEMQKKFQEKINWRIGPLPIQREIRNVKTMGLVLIITTLLTVVYVVVLGNLI